MNQIKQIAFARYITIINLFLCVLLFQNQAFTQQASRSKKKMTFVVYLAADNNLHLYAWNVIKQLESVGSNENINIVVQINAPGKHNKTLRFYINKDNATLIQSPGQAPTEKLNSGDHKTLVDCVSWAMKYYPAENLILNIWGHGSGAYDPSQSKSDTNLHHLRFNLDIADDDDCADENKRRGICFDDHFKSYINNQNLKIALHEIQHKILGGKKIAVLWLESCFMSMIEVMSIFKTSVEFVVASENVVYAPGSDYQRVMSPFLKKSMNAKEFATHVVESFQQTYGHTKRKFTFAAINTSQIEALEKNISSVAQQLLIALQNQKGQSITKLLQKSKTCHLCACLEEPSFIDLRQFYLNLQAGIQQINLINKNQEGSVKLALTNLLDQGLRLISQAIIANATGAHLKSSCGLSIYFPELGLFPLYLQSSFARSNQWSNMIIQYLQLKQ